MSRTRAAFRQVVSALMLLAALVLATHAGPALADDPAASRPVAGAAVAMAGPDHDGMDPRMGRDGTAPCKCPCCGPGTGCLSVTPASAVQVPLPAPGRVAGAGLPAHDAPRPGFEPPGFPRPPRRA